MIKILLLWNLFAFLLMGFDKKQSRGKGQRISEKTLLGVAILGGGLGAFIGAKFFHHKTKKTAFKIILPLGCILAIAILGYLIYKT